MRHHPRRIRQYGLGVSAATVFEILVALAILSFSIIPILLFLSTGTETVRGTRDTASAIAVANRTLEEIRAVPFADLPAAAKAMNSSPGVVVGPTTYHRTLTLSPVNKKDGKNSVVAWLKVDWTRDRRKNLTYEVGTVLTDVR